MRQGEALERGQVDFNMLEDYINNPERQVSEAEKLGACVCSLDWQIGSREHIIVPPYEGCWCACLLRGCVPSRCAHHVLTGRNVAAAGLYSAALAIPIRQTEDVHRSVVKCRRCLRAFLHIVLERIGRL